MPTPTLVWFGRWLWMRRAASFLLQLLLELLNLRSDHGAAVWLVWMCPEKVLMIIIGFIEFFQRHDLGDDRLDEILLSFGLGLLGSRLLIFIRVEDDRTVLRATVSALLVQGRGIVSFPAGM